MELDEAIDIALRLARGLGDVEGDVLAVESDRLEVGVRLGKTEKLKRSRERRLAVRLFRGHSSAIVSTSDLSPRSLEMLVADCRELARATTADPFSGLADLGDQPPWPAELDLFDPSASAMTAQEALSLAEAAERAALDCDARLTNSEGAEVSVSARRLSYATSRGFQGAYRSSSFALTVVPVATADGTMQRDYWYTAARSRERLEDPAASEPKPLRVPCDGSARARWRPARFRSFSTPRSRPVWLGISAVQSVAPRSIAGRPSSATASGLGSRLGGSASSTIRCDARAWGPEALRCRRAHESAQRGRRRRCAARRFSSTPTRLASSAPHRPRARCGRFAEPPSVGISNFYLEAGTASPEQVIDSVRRGFYVTELIGSGINAGDRGLFARGRGDVDRGREIGVPGRGGDDRRQPQRDVREHRCDRRRPRVPFDGVRPDDKDRQDDGGGA